MGGKNGFLESDSIRVSRRLKWAALSRDAATRFELLPCGSLLFVTRCKKSGAVSGSDGDGPIRPTLQNYWEQAPRGFRLL